MSKADSIVPVILSGGAGTRLWPLSREMYPKQLLALTSRQTMLQDTAARLAGIKGATAPIVVCNEAHRFTVAEQLRTLRMGASAILLEPVGRNTAPAVALAALQAQQSDPEAILIVAPADHVIRDAQSFQAAAVAALPLAEQGKLVTFGIVAHAPETGYGYIRRGERRRSRVSGRAIHRKAAARCRAAIRRLRRLLLEQRHVHVQGGRYLVGTQGVRARYSGGLHGCVSGCQDGSGFRPYRAGRVRESAAASPSTMR